MIELIAFTYFASYILSRGGPAHQYILIRSLPDDRSISNNTKTSNISTNYRGFDNLLYLVELAWGLSLTPISAIVSFGNALSSLRLREQGTGNGEQGFPRSSNKYCSFVPDSLWGLIPPLSFSGLQLVRVKSLSNCSLFPVPCSPFPLTLIFPSLILLEIWKDRQDKNVLKWCFIYLVFTSFALTLMLANWEVFKSVSAWLGHSVIIICLISLWGMFENIRAIYKSKNPKQQSLPEIYLKIFKDIIGVIYCFTVGIENLYPLAIALASRGSLRIIHLIVYLYYSNKSKLTANKQQFNSNNQSIFLQGIMLLDRFTSERFFKNFSLTIFSLSAILLILFALDFIITDYQGFTFIPGLRIFTDRLFIDSTFIATNTIEYYWGNVAIELIIASIFFVQITNLLEPLIYRQIRHNLLHWRNFALSFILLISINFVFSNLSF